MRGGLAEIIETGQAPGFNTKAIDPYLPEKAVPKAFKDLEQTQSASKIARDAGFSVKKIKQVWNILALLTALLAMPAIGADLTRSITFSDGSRLTAAQLHTLVDGASISTAFLTGKDLLSSVDSSDYVLIYDTSAAAFKRMTLSSLLLANTGLITSQTDKANPVSADYFLIYDSAGVALGKASYTNLFTGNTNLIGWQPVLTDITADAALLLRHGGTNTQIAPTNLWKSFLYRAAFTNLAEHTTPTNVDKLLIWDATAGTNKWTGLTGLITNRPASVSPAMTSQIGLVETGMVKRITLTELNATLATNLTTFTSSNYPMSSATASAPLHNAAHGLGVTPKFVRGVLACTTDDIGYKAGDEVELTQFASWTAASTFTTPCIIVWGNSTNVGAAINFQAADKTIFAVNRDTGAATSITKARWNMKIYARP